MKLYLIAVGGMGHRVLESLVWSAAADVLTFPEGIKLLSADVDASSAENKRARQRVADYEAVRTLLNSLPYTHRGFQTPLRLHEWTMDVPATVEAQTNASPQGRLLARALFTPEEQSQTAEDGFWGNAALGALCFAQRIAHMDAEAAQGQPDALAALLADMKHYLEAGEKVRVLLCGAADGGTGAAGVTLLARLLRERVTAAEIGALLILPDETMRNAKAVLRAYSRTDFLRQGEAPQTGVLNALYLLGTLAENGTAVQAGTNLSKWLAARCAGHFFTEPLSDGPARCYDYQINGVRAGWNLFAQEEARYRRAYGGLMKAALCWRAELYPALQKKLTTRRHLKDRRLGWYAANFRSMKKLSEAERSRIIEQLAAAEACFSGFAYWMNEIIDGLPAPLRQGREVEAAQQASRENLRQLMEENARHTLSLRLAEERVQETQVSRAQDAEGDEALRRPLKERETKLGALRARQLTLDARTGGAFRIRTLEALRAESQRGLERAEQGILTLAEKLQALEALPAEERGEAAPAGIRELLWKEKRRRDIFAARKQWTEEQLTPPERERMAAIQPAYAPKGDLPLNEFFDPATLRDMRRLWSEEAPSAKTRRAAEQGFEKLVQQETPDPVTFSRLMAALGSGAGWRRDLSPLALLIAQLLENVMEEGQA